MAAFSPAFGLAVVWAEAEPPRRAAARAAPIKIRITFSSMRLGIG
jgi:hypothetical protein